MNESGQGAFAVFGLGNVGSDGTRHNVGFAIIDALRTALPGRYSETKKHRCIFTEHQISPGKLVLLAKPQTSVNDSGRAVRSLANHFSVLPERVIVIHDDFDLPLGTLRVRNRGSAGGHNGVADILKRMGSNCAIVRIKVGICGPEAGLVDPARYVLKGFTKNEQDLVSRVIVRAVQCAQALLSGIGFEQVTNTFNKSVEDMDKKKASHATKSIAAPAAAVGADTISPEALFLEERAG